MYNEEILYKKWNFKGFTVTDWGGNNDRVKGLIAGNQLEMPASGGFSDQEIVNAVKTVKLSEELLNTRVESLLNIVFEVYNNKPEKGIDFNKNHLKAKEFASKSIVLLKNDNNALPLKDKEKIAVIGDFAQNPRYQGAGSSLINPTKIDNSLELLNNSELNIIGFQKGFHRLGRKSTHLINKAISLAKKADTILLYIGLDEGIESEGIDRSILNIRQNQLDLIDHLTPLNKKIIVVLAGGAPIEMPFIKNVDAVIHGYLFGQAGAGAIVDAITGVVNPSGKLAETYPFKYSDIPSANYYPGNEVNAQHREAIYVGYRYFDTINKDVLFPFGYGLSYTKFKYSDLKVTKNGVSFRIKNIGDVYGEEIAQLYIESLDSKLFNVKKQLKGFVKVGLQPTEEKVVEIEFDKHTFAHFNIINEDWVVEKGQYKIHIGENVRDINLTSEISINGEEIKNPYENNFEKYYSADVHNISKGDFEQLVGDSIDDDKWDVNKKLELNDIVAQLQYTNWLGKFIYRIIYFIHKLLFKLGKPILSNYIIFAINTSFKQAYRYSNGKINEEMMLGIIDMFNTSLYQGFKKYRKAKKEYKKSLKQ